MLSFEDRVKYVIDHLRHSGQSEGIAIEEILRSMRDDGELTEELAVAICDEFIAWAKAAKKMIQSPTMVEKILKKEGK